MLEVLDFLFCAVIEAKDKQIVIFDQKNIKFMSDAVDPEYIIPDPQHCISLGKPTCRKVHFLTPLCIVSD
jgi:hypothetical protein